MSQGNGGETFERESMEVDVLYVGAGPASLGSAIHLVSLRSNASPSFGFGCWAFQTACSSFVNSS